jgi:hypothetical protein
LGAPDHRSLQPFQTGVTSSAASNLYPLKEQGALDLGRIPALWSKMDKHGVQDDLHCRVQFRTRDLAVERTFY